MSETPGIFITGSSTGLGRAAAVLFAARGWRVVATMRRPVPIPGVTTLQLDVTKPDEIAAAAAQAIDGGRIDVVFNNAGYGLAGPLEAASDAQIVDEVETNLMGVIRTTRAFIPYFRERCAGMFINTTSIGGLVTFPFNSVYHATKWAVEGFSESLAYELAHVGIRVKTVAPGGIRTDFAGRSLVIALHPAYADPVKKALAAFTDPARTAKHSSPEQIAEVVFEAATDGSRRLRYVAGDDARETYAQRLETGDEAFREAVAKRFFGEP
jgi:NAD(P)-dependent dehydrogenase (short-subunit alcohol dehydrogenase family)